jgi:hypothetical protein
MTYDTLNIYVLCGINADSILFSCPYLNLQIFISHLKHCKPEGRGFGSRGGHWMFPIGLILPAALWP